MRWLKELFNPSLKCQRLGHKQKVIKVVIRKRSTDFREVAADYKASIMKCTRCESIARVTVKEKIEWYTSVTMPDHMWDEIRDNGYLILRYI